MASDCHCQRERGGMNVGHISNVIVEEKKKKGPSFADGGYLSLPLALSLYTPPPL
jgi:hypothetical protein